MPFARLDTAAIARSLAQIADRPGDVVDACFERLEIVELPPGGASPGLRVRREQGLAIRLLRDGNNWLGGRDEVTSGSFTSALRQTARALPPAPYPAPELRVADWAAAPDATEMQPFTAAVEAALRHRLVAFPLELRLRRHRRWLQVVGPRLVPAAEYEAFYSLEATMPWARHGALLTELSADSADEVATHLVDLFTARKAASPPAGRGAVVLAPAAAAVMLHEAVAHSLEADVLAIAGGPPEAALGVRLGMAGLDVLDNPATSPGQTARQSDDEGTPVSRRWLLRGGVVEELLADRTWCGRCEWLSAGAGRRGSRHLPPGPRSTHLELLPGELSTEQLLALADGGLWVPAALRGRLDPLSGRFVLVLPGARRIAGGALADPVGPFRLEGGVADLLGAITGIGRDAVSAGAGWCAKGGQLLPVWATTPALALRDVDIVA